MRGACFAVAAERRFDSNFRINLFLGYVVVKMEGKESRRVGENADTLVCC